ncbi:MAG: murein biosynthesis integral membrane protein MurJ [Deinococcota bacterium]
MPSEQPFSEDTSSSETPELATSDVAIPSPDQPQGTTRPAVTRPAVTRNAITLMIGTLASRVSGLVRTSLLLQLFPVTMTDAFLVAWKIPNLFRELLAEGALTNSFVPVYASLKGDDAKKLTAALTVSLAIINSLLLVLALYAAPWLVDLMLAEGSSVNVTLAVQLTRLTFPVLFAISLAALAMGVLNAEERFFAPAWAPVALNIAVILGMLLFPANVHALALSVVAGGLLQLLVQLPSLWRHRLIPTRWQLWHPQLLDVLLLMAPFALTTGARQVLNVVANYQLSLLPAGSVTAYENANLLVSLALGLFSVSPALAFYSRLSQQATHAPDNFASTLLSGCKLISFLTAPVGLLMLVLAEPAVRTIWDIRLASGQSQTIQYTILAVVPLGLAIFPLGLNNLLLRPFYIRKQVRTVIAISVGFMGLSAVLYALLVPGLGIAGLSVTTALVNWLQLATLLLWLRRTERLELLTFTRHAARVWLAASAAAFITWGLIINLPDAKSWLQIVLRVGLGGCIGLGCYGIFALLLNLSEVQQLKNRFLRQPSD